MIPLRLTEYRSDGNDYPIVIIFSPGAVIREAELKPAGPHIVGETKTLGLGSFITLQFNNTPITVRETVDSIIERLAKLTNP